MCGILRTYQDSVVSGIVWFASPDGNYYTLETGLVGKKLSERKYFPGLNNASLGCIQNIMQ